MGNKKNDWIGQENSVFKTLGSSHHSKDDRAENDYYATDPKAAEMLINLENLDTRIPILEPSCGEGHLSKVFIENGFNVISSDLIDRGYGDVKDFFEYDYFNGYIITNPPYTFGKEFIKHAIDIAPTGSKICMFLKTQFLEGKTRRKELFDAYPPKRIWVSSSRINCAKNGNFEGLRETGGSAVAYAWYIWEKGFKGETILKWFN